jgi:hypothetical protein
VATQKPEILAGRHGPSLGQEVPPDTLFDVRAYTVDDAYDLSLDTETPFQVLHDELKFAAALTTDPHEMSVANRRIAQLAKRSELDEFPERRYPVRALIGLAIQASAELATIRSTSKAYRSHLYLQAQDLLAQSGAIDKKVLNLGDHYGAAIAIANIFGNSTDIRVAQETVGQFINQRRQRPNMLMDDSTSRTLQRQLIKLCDVDSSPTAIGLLCDNAVDVYEYGTLIEMKASPKDITAQLAAPRTAVDPAIIQGAYTALIASLGIHHERQDIIRRVMVHAQQHGVMLAPQEVRFRDQLKLQGEGSAGQRSFLRLVETLGSVATPLDSDIEATG